MFESCCSPHESAHLLRSRYGLPVEQAGADLYLVNGLSVEAIGLPADLGRLLCAQLAEQPATPAVADPHDRHWIFLVSAPAPFEPVPLRLRHLLTAHRAVFPGPGAHIPVPGDDHVRGWHWASAPRAGRLCVPSRAAVLDAVCRIVLHGACPVSA